MCGLVRKPHEVCQRHQPPQDFRVEAYDSFWLVNQLKEIETRRFRPTYPDCLHGAAQHRRVRRH